MFLNRDPSKRVYCEKMLSFTSSLDAANMSLISKFNLSAGLIDMFCSILSVTNNLLVRKCFETLFSDYLAL